MKLNQGLRFAILLVVVTIFAGSAVFSYQRHTETSEQLAMVQKTGAWAASELEGDLQKFIHTLDMTGLGKRSAEDLQLRFDLLWARMDSLSTGSETLEVRSQSGAEQLFSELWQQMRFSEQALLALKPGDWEGSQRIAAPFRALQPQVREFNVKSFYAPAEMFPEMKAEEPIGFGLSMLGLLLSGAMLVVLVVRESARNRMQALLDDLTGLPNRKYFNHQLRECELRARRSQGSIGLLVIDLNNFKEINDTLGHAAGDKLLIRVAERLKEQVPDGEMVARMGGDEFAVLLEQVGDHQRCTRLARDLCESIGRVIEIGDNQVFASASIGVSFYPDDAERLSQVMVNADMAMYMAKRDAGVSYRVFEPEMNAGLLRRRELAEQLRQAIANNQLSLNYQPLVRLDSGLIESVEALLRWHHPKHGYISPLEMVSIAEQYDLAKELNEWVLATACKQSVIWQSARLPQIKVAVNVSPGMYTKHDLVQSVARIINYYGMRPELLVLEVTEDTTMRDIESSPDILNGLRELGVELALDDFGTGYSSLSHLKQLPVQKLKIDKSFVQDLNNEPKDLRFIRTILGLAASLELEVVAEGIELPQNLSDLLDEGCTLGQGYLFSRPVDAATLEGILRDQAMGVLLPPWNQRLRNCANIG